MIQSSANIFGVREKATFENRRDGEKSEVFRTFRIFFVGPSMIFLFARYHPTKLLRRQTASVQPGRRFTQYNVFSDQSEGYRTRERGRK
jgi:hypothetical protein